MKNLKALIIVWSLLAAVASAAAVWDTKPFMEWSDKDMEKLLTDSPWAGKATLTHEREGANLGPVQRHARHVIIGPFFRAAGGDDAAAFRFDEFDPAGIGESFFGRIDDLDQRAVRAGGRQARQHGLDFR